MYIPDRVMVRKIQEYDPYLFVLWNPKGYFELWRRMVWGRRLITPVTASIYDTRAPKEYTPLDERILWWLWEADSWRHKSSTEYALKQDKRWKEIQKTKDKKLNTLFRDLAKDTWHDVANFYATKHKKKNPKRTMLKRKNLNSWIRPDVKSNMSSRLFQRSHANAKAYNYRPPK